METSILVGGINMKPKIVQKPDVGRDYYVNSDNVFIASFDKDTPDKGVAEEFGVALGKDDLLTALGKIGISKADTDLEPPAGGPWRFVSGAWSEVPKTYQELRAPELAKLRIPDQLDALVKLARMTPAEKAQVEAAKNPAAAPGTPEWLLGNIDAIKNRYPKDTP